MCDVQSGPGLACQSRKQVLRRMPSPAVPRPADMKWMQYVIAIAALLGILTALTVGLFSASRIVMAASRDWLLPPFLARISPRTQTPLVAQIALGVIIGGWGWGGALQAGSGPATPACLH